MIWLVIGPRGSGKTTWAVRELLRRHSASGRMLCTNLALTNLFTDRWKGDITSLDSVQVLRFWEYCPPGSVIAIDEVQVVFNSRNWVKLQKEAPELLTFLSHSRKSGDELYLLTQEPARIDAQMRGQVDISVDVRSSMWLRSMGLPVPGYFAWARLSTGVDQQAELIRGGGIFLCKKYFKMFDSYSQRIAESAGLTRGTFNVAGLRPGISDTGHRSGQSVAEFWRSKFGRSKKGNGSTRSEDC